MSSLQFPPNPTNGQIYPANPAIGETQYRFDAPADTWRLLGAGGATGVVAGTYGSQNQIPQFTVTASGVITQAQNFSINGIVGSLQTVTDNGATTTNPITIDIPLSTPAGLIVQDPNPAPLTAPDRAVIHPSYITVENGHITVEVNSTETIRMEGTGTPFFRVQRGGYITLWSGDNVNTETIRLNSAGGTGAFDGELVAGNFSTNGNISATGTGNEVADLTIGNLNYATTDATAGQVMTTDGLGNLTLQPNLTNLQLLGVQQAFNGTLTQFTLVQFGTTTAFSPNPSTNIVVFLGGVPLTPAVQYSVTGSTITFATPPAASTAFYALANVTL